MDRSLLLDILDWDVDAWSVALHSWEQSVDFRRVQRCMDLGAGRGGLSLWLALKGKHVVCVDRDARWIPHQRKLHDRYGVGGLVSYETLDATRSLGDATFDLIVAKSFFGSFAPAIRRTVVAMTRGVLAPRGALLFAENLKATPLHRLGRLFVRGRRSPWYYLAPGELLETMRELGEVDLHCTGLLAPFGRSEQQRRSLARLDGWLAGVVPASWKYIGYGVAGR